MKSWLTENIILKLSDKVKGHEVYRFYNEFRETLNLSRNEIEELQTKKLKKLVEYAYINVPFYKQRFIDNKITPGNIKSLDDLQKLPPLTRTELQQNWQNLISTKYSITNLYKGSSSGSTGIPVIYYHDSRGISAGQAAGFLGWSLTGWKLGLKGLHIWGNPTTVKNEWGRTSSKFKAFLFNHHKFPAYKLTDEKEFRELAELIRNKNYDYIDGYTNAIYLLSDYVKANKLLGQDKLKLVLTTAENLQDFQRDSINKYLGPVYDNYGCGEINGIASQCNRCGKYHILDPHVYVEFGTVVDDEGGRELLITDLDNYAFPLIRYKNDDVAIKIDEKEIECNIKYSRILKISGRHTDIIRFPGGGTLSVPSFFGSMLLKKLKGIKQYQVIREEENLLTILFVKTNDFSEVDLGLIMESLDEYLNGKMKYNIRFVDKIDVSKTGKFKILIDKIK
jgi:phenylacetate-CoA ligase